MCKFVAKLSIFSQPAKKISIFLSKKSIIPILFYKKSKSPCISLAHDRYVSKWSISLCGRMARIAFPSGV